MAKEKTYAVTVTYPVTRIVFVQARRPSTARERALTEEGWRQGVTDEDAPWSVPRGAEVTDVRQM